MTEVAFHFNVADPAAYLCRLVRKVVIKGHKLVAVGPVDRLQALDLGLWQLSATDFWPHAWGNAPAEVLLNSPVLLYTPDMLHVDLPHRDVLINLCEGVPDCTHDFAIAIEVVGMDEAARHAARLRWKSHTQAGRSLVRHDVALQGLAA